MISTAGELSYLIHGPRRGSADSAAASRPASGVAGAICVDSWFFSRFGSAGDVAFFGCDMEISRRYGAANPGAASFIRAETRTPNPSRTAVYDLGSVNAPGPSEAMIEIADTAAMVARQGGLPVLIGCDHTASLAGLLGSARDEEERPVYVYFDAHFDLGRNCEVHDLLHNGGFVGEMLRRHWVSCAVNIGGRSAATRFDYPRTPRFVSIPAYASLRSILQCLSTLRGRTLYVSLDADVLDPTHAPNVSCPEPGGLAIETLQETCRWLGRNCRVIGADLMEVVPRQGGPEVEPRLVECLLELSGNREMADSRLSALTSADWGRRREGTARSQV